MSTRNYNYKDVDMLLASKTIAQALKEYINDLSMVRSTWTNEYAIGYTSKIDDVIDNVLGLDKKKELRQATARLSAIQAPALRNLSFLKTQIEVDYGDKAEEMLKVLGFTKNLRNAQRGDQEALIQLLYSFKKNMTEEMQQSIVEKGTNPALITGIIDYANQLLEANVSQETLKETSKALSNEAINALNDIYDETIGICKIAASFYQYEPIKKEQFTFSKVVAQMGVSKKAAKENTEV